MIRPSSSFSSSAPCGKTVPAPPSALFGPSAATSCFDCSTFPECGSTGRCVASCLVDSSFIAIHDGINPTLRENLIRQRPNPLHHPRQPVAPLHRDELFQADAVEKPLNVERQNLPCPLPGEKLLQNSDQPAHDVRVRIRQKFQRILRPHPLPPEQVHRAHAPVHARLRHLEQIRHRRQ